LAGTATTFCQSDDSDKVVVPTRTTKARSWADINWCALRLEPSLKTLWNHKYACVLRSGYLNHNGVSHAIRPRAYDAGTVNTVLSLLIALGSTTWPDHTYVWIAGYSVCNRGPVTQQRITCCDIRAGSETRDLSVSLLGSPSRASVPGLRRRFLVKKPGIAELNVRKVRREIRSLSCPIQFIFSRRAGIRTKTAH
jgi:hypothetical protein